MPKEPKEPIVLTADDVVAAPPALIRAGIETLPATIAAAGAHTSERFIEFFTANIRNRNTRMAYALAVRQFFDWVRATRLAAGRYQANDRGRLHRAARRRDGQAVGQTASGRRPATLRLLGYRWHPTVKPGRCGARSQVRGEARQASGSVGRPGSATVGLDRRDGVQWAPRSRPDRRHGLQLRPRERRCGAAHRGLLRARQARLAAATRERWEVSRS